MRAPHHDATTVAKRRPRAQSAPPSQSPHIRDPAHVQDEKGPSLALGVSKLSGGHPLELLLDLQQCGVLDLVRALVADRQLEHCHLGAVDDLGVGAEPLAVDTRVDCVHVCRGRLRSGQCVRVLLVEHLQFGRLLRSRPLVLCVVVGVPARVERVLLRRGRLPLVARPLPLLLPRLQRFLGCPHYEVPIVQQPLQQQVALKVALSAFIQ
mmetsp:Transcript_106794/g.309825  ORF Transcript_106794/g.309825 Transcript_106794/m.309825 type:complete len:209 (-) Transcript_106794:76-702(-)